MRVFPYGILVITFSQKLRASHKISRTSKLRDYKNCITKTEKLMTCTLVLGVFGGDGKTFPCLFLFRVIGFSSVSRALVSRPPFVCDKSVVADHSIVCVWLSLLPCATSNERVIRRLYESFPSRCKILFCWVSGRKLFYFNALGSSSVNC